MKYLPLIFLISIIILAFVFCFAGLPGSQFYKNSSRFPLRTTFSQLDREHQEMADALDKFYQLAIAHWQSEEKLYQEGKMRLPSNHPHDVATLWKEHNAQHQEFIARIKKMQQDLIDHIKVYDIPHFHYGPD
jgi:DNA-binding transcriptional regulator YbjK